MDLNNLPYGMCPHCMGSFTAGHHCYQYEQFKKQNSYKIKIGNNEYVGPITHFDDAYEGCLVDGNNTPIDFSDLLLAIKELMQLRQQLYELPLAEVIITENKQLRSENEEYRQRHDWELCRKLDDELSHLRNKVKELESFIEDDSQPIVHMKPISTKTYRLVPIEDNRDIKGATDSE